MTRRLLYISLLIVLICTGWTFVHSQASCRSVSALQAIHLRGGPGTNYRMVETVPAGTSLCVHGVSADGLWQMVSSSHSIGWANVAYITTTSNEGLPIFNAKTTLTPTPSPTSPPPQSQSANISSSSAPLPDLSCHYDARTGTWLQLSCDHIVVNPDGSVDANKSWIGIWYPGCQRPVYSICMYTH